ncbi:unnamed protein product [Rotaria sp. Silwood1]|nr:unnamed protein product [Rotaria sp. Silwood1]CAF4682645.1 unnamed protein product [Rotaria sp. Silwood1]
MRAIRLLRILKLYLVFKQLKVLRALSTTLKESLIDFSGTLFGLVVLAFLFGAAAYVAETQANPEMFDSIPKATYWGIITITTVGYGDMYPITVIGRTIACLCALSGAAIIVFTEVLTRGTLVTVIPLDERVRLFIDNEFGLGSSFAGCNLPDGLIILATLTLLALVLGDEGLIEKLISIKFSSAILVFLGAATFPKFGTVLLPICSPPAWY